MTEDEAREWIAVSFGSDKERQLARYVELLDESSQIQNLISRSTVASLWSRHIVDSAQLLSLAPTDWDHWVDVGSGAGLPGMVIGLLSRRTVTLVEPRRLRVEFLNACCKELALHTVQVVQAKAEAVRTATPADVVSARAVAKLDELFRITRSFANTRTAYVLPKGESAENEVAMARRSWHGSFHVKRSVVDERSGIVVATGVSPK